MLHTEHLILEVVKGYERELTRLGLEGVDNTTDIIRTIIEKHNH